VARSPSVSADPLHQPRALLAGLSPAQFMRRHWQRRPLWVRQAWPGVQPPASRKALFDLCGQDDVESRCIEQRDGRWLVRHGPLGRRSLPPLSRPAWTLLVQGLDLHLEAAHAMLRAFDFIPQARLDDLMLSYASDGGGVGPHVDSYDVFLLQVQGRRRWRIAPPGDATLAPNQPLRILARFQAQDEWVLEPGDLLYLPPGWGHDGVALGGDCMTASIGFRSPTVGELTAALLQRMAEELVEDMADEGHSAPHGGGMTSPWSRRYADVGSPATERTGAVPAALAGFAQKGLRRLGADEQALARALGRWLTEPKPQVWFAPSSRPWRQGQGVVLDRRTRMAHDARHVFINGEAFRVAGVDGRLLRTLADRRRLDGTSWSELSVEARQGALEWIAAGWLHPDQC
jgi:50S ribosomal protein L16 3-hydroxylase